MDKSFSQAKKLILLIIIFFAFLFLGRYITAHASVCTDEGGSCIPPSGSSGCSLNCDICDNTLGCGGSTTCCNPITPTPTPATPPCGAPNTCIVPTTCVADNGLQAIPGYRCGGGTVCCGEIPPTPTPTPSPTPIPCSSPNFCTTRNICNIGNGLQIESGFCSGGNVCCGDIPPTPTPTPTTPPPPTPTPTPGLPNGGPGSTCGANNSGICVYSQRPGPPSYTTAFANACPLLCPSIPSCNSLDHRYFDIPSNSSDCLAFPLNFAPYRCCRQQHCSDYASLGFVSAGSLAFCPSAFLNKNTGQYEDPYYTFDTYNYVSSDTGCCVPKSCGTVGGTCIDVSQQSCNSIGMAYDPNGAGNVDLSCGPPGVIGQPQTCCQPYSNFPNCTNSGTICHDTNRPPANDCSINNTSQVCSTGATQPQPCNPVNFTNQQSFTTTDNCNKPVGYVCTNNVCTTAVTVNLHNDYDSDGAGGTADGVVDSTLSLDGGIGQSTTNGKYQFPGVTMGNHTVTLTLPAGYNLIASTAKDNTGNSNNTTASPNVNTTFNLGTNNGNEQVDYYISKTYSISGAVYVDLNETGHLAGNSLYTGNDSVTITGPIGGNQTTQTINNVSYTANNLAAGQYQVTHNPPAGYIRFYPKFATFSVIVGTPGQSPACSTNGYNDATCDANGNITGLNFGITNSIPSSTITCSDVRLDAGISVNIPSTWDCAGTVSPNYLQTSASLCPTLANTAAGIGFSGNADPLITGGGNLSASGWQVGNSTYPETFSPRIPKAVTTSYEFISDTVKNSGLLTKNLSTVCNVSGCDLSSLSNGIYTYTGPVTIAASHLKTNTIVLLINGDVTIAGNILVDPGAVDIFAVTGNITIAPNVGEASTTSNAGDVEGLFTTDESFIIDSAYALGQHCNLDGTPKDLRANIQGSITTNAKSINQAGGSYVENRSLCKTNFSCPVDTITARPDMLLSLPALVENSNNVFQEVAPGPGD